ncbi:MAG: Saccharopine dehydrogenase [Massilia sp.]|nr:Saccharopine dehydrogenase [Massilia sp.]
MTTDEHRPACPADPPCRVLLLGGYGFFGKRLAARLALDPLVHLTICGRDLGAAEALASSLNKRFHAQRIDALAPGLVDQIRASGAGVVVHASGPFQGQGYAVARACIAAGVHYIDFSDGREFVCGITELDDDARNANVFVISGASSVPALSTAVVDSLAHDFTQVDAIDIGINPGNRTERGLATVRAILGYCGAAFPHWRDGRWQRAFGWQGLRRQAYPAPVGVRWLAHCDVPDLQLLPARYPGVRTVSFRGGTELRLLHFGAWIMAAMRRAGLVRDWSRYSIELKALSDLFIRFGTDAGAMHVELTGMGQSGEPLRRCWTLVALDGDGPFVPTLASAALVGKVARGQLAFRGAGPCVGLLTVQDFLDAAKGLAITTETNQ